jgi:hypothetical protein
VFGCCGYLHVFLSEIIFEIEFLYRKNSAKILIKLKNNIL